MHEFSIAKSICDIAVEEARRHGCGRVTAVECRVGVMRQVVAELLVTAFEATARGTALEGAVLRMEREPLSVICAGCGRTTEADEIVATCPACGSPSIRFSGGMEMTIASITAEQEDHDEDHRAARCA